MVPPRRQLRRAGQAGGGEGPLFHPARQIGAPAEVVRRPAAHRAAVHRLRRVLLDQLPLQQQGHLVAHSQGLPLVVGHQNGGGGELPVEGEDQLPHVLPQVLVQGGEGLVQQQQGRLRRQGPGQGHPLLLPAGEGVDPPPATARQLDPLQQGLRPLQPLPPVHSPHLQGEGHILRRRHVGEQPQVLKDDHRPPPVGGQGRHVPPSQEDLPPSEGHQPRHGFQQGALSAAGGAQQSQKGPVFHRQGHVAQDGRAPQGDGQIVDTQFHYSSPLLSRRWMAHSNRANTSRAEPVNTAA